MIATLPMHPEHDLLTGELHARPALPLTTPVAISRIASVIDAGADRRQAVEHLASLCRRYGMTPPALDADFVLADFGRFSLRYERHTEFDGWTFFCHPSSIAPFDEIAIKNVPTDWLTALPGKVLVASHIAVIRTQGEGESPPSGCFVTENLTGADLFAGAATCWTDFRPGPDGFSRLLLQDHGMSAPLTGRLAQVLWEIETYRMLALLALPTARVVSTELGRASERLAAIAARLPELTDLDQERAALAELTDLAADIEQQAAATADRFSAAPAYHALIGQRLQVLREQRLRGLPTLSEYLERRLDPAIATVESARMRIAALSTRCGRALELLRARVAVTQEAQTQKLLAAMAETGRAQLRMQETVEGLSVAAISYYVLSLLGYALRPLPDQAWISNDLLLALLIPAVAVLVWIRMRRRRIRPMI